MNPDKFYQRTKLFNDILYEIFNVESNYRTELNVLNLKLLRKIEDHNKKITKRRQDKLLQSLTNTKTMKLSDKNLNTKTSLKISSTSTSENVIGNSEENPMIDKLISEGLQNLFTFYKTKHKIISQEVSNLGIIIYGFSSSQKKYEQYENLENLDNLQKNFDLNFAKFMKIKKKYFERMNDLELFFHELENKKRINNINKKNPNEDSNISIMSVYENPTEKEKIKEKEKEKTDELIELREKYKKYLAELTHNQKAYIAKINEIGNDIQEFNISENNILYDIFKVFENELLTLLKEVNNFCLLYDHNKQLIQDLNIELGNNIIYDDRIYINYKFEEYTPKFTDINNPKDFAVIQKMNKLIGFEFDKIKTNHPVNDTKLTDSILYNKNIDDNLLFILLMEKFTSGESMLNEKEQNLMINLFNQEIYIKQFLSRLNKIRINKHLFNQKEKFDVLLKFFNIIYSKFSFTDEKSHDLVKFLLILSETFHYKEGDKKIFLNNVIKPPEELKHSIFWIKYIEQEIEIEYKKYENKKNTRYEYIVLLSNTTHLKEYSIPKNIMKDIVEYFIDKYKFTVEEIDIIKEQLKI